jgi:hypothetical protein
VPGRNLLGLFEPEVETVAPVFTIEHKSHIGDLELARPDVDRAPDWQRADHSRNRRPSPGLVLIRVPKVCRER